jgi:hypothetical protein
MRKARTVLILGIWVAILPYLGFPDSWKTVLFTLSGLGLVYLSILMFKENKKVEKTAEQIFDNFSENNFFEQDKDV